MNEIRQSLSRATMFAELSDDQRSFLAERFVPSDHARGDLLFAQGTPRLGLTLILEGEVELVDASMGRRRQLAVCEPDTVLSESIWVEAGVHTVDAVALSDGRAARLPILAVDEVRRTHPELYTAMLIAVNRLLSRRMSHASRGDRGRAGGVGFGHTRREHDLIGWRDVPASVLWGVQTLRAIENFDISGVRLDHFPEMIDALARVKRACAVANRDLGLLDADRAEAIVTACDEILHGRWHGHFVVDMVQGGAGTSTNMNANEVIANRALELLGHQRGEYEHLHPNNHVNLSQSTNDVYPSALKLALLEMHVELIDEVEALARSFEQKGEEFAHVIKMGRTQLQDAVPMTLGQELRAWGRTIRKGKDRVNLAMRSLHSMNMGGTAIGTGINTDPRYPELVVAELSRLTGHDLFVAEDLIEETQDTASLVEVAGVLKMLAVRISKFSNDLRLLSSGPRCGLAEINLPAVQPGSSIMPGKVNPVIPEVMNQVAFQVIGLDTTVALASEAGQLELNVFEPIIAFNLFQSIRMLARAVRTLRLRCVDGITANEDHCRDLVLNSIGIVTVLNPYLGYERTSVVAKEAHASGRSVREVVLELGYMTAEELDRALSPEAMTRPVLFTG